jgi:hypothetical protein
MSHPPVPARSILPLMAAAPLLLMALGAAASAAELPATKIFENAQFRYSVALPAGCRHEEGPGTLDAICSPEFDAEKSAEASAAASLVLEVDSEGVADDAGKATAELAQRYNEANFRDELPEAICGEQDKARVKIADVKQVLEEGRVVYTASVTCPEIRFLGLGERGALAQFLITPGLRYRLMARAQKDDFAQNKTAIDAFFASFRALPGDPKKP